MIYKKNGIIRAIEDQSATNVNKQKTIIAKIFNVLFIFSFLKIAINATDIANGNKTLVLLNILPVIILNGIPKPKQNAKWLTTAKLISLKKYFLISLYNNILLQ